MSYPIHYAASAKFSRSSSKEKMVPITQELLKGNANPLLTFNQKGDSIIHDIFENEGIVEPFLEIPDLDLEARDSNGRTYLLAACSTADNYWRNYDMEWLVAKPSPAQLVLAKGADIAAIDNQGRNVFHHLLKSSSRYSTLRACHRTDFKHFLAHPQAATLAVQKDAKGATPLHHALRGSQLWSIDLLLAKGADSLETDSDGNTALHHLASQFCSPSPYCDPNPLTAPLFEKFLSFGISINTPDHAGETPLFKLISSSGFCMDNLQMFERKGADLMVRDKMGRGLLHAIVKIGNILVKKDGVEVMEVGIFRHLMGKGLDPMMEDAEQRSSLDVEMASGSVGILEIFKREK
ncbi:ankyrin repeat-containing domain protein [Leptodontidium sp. MPI-SDFR-AT-0119]|nr:ankyrin repeat-containing domain protein [Leptodontidium sp. MPI-SDFR-AT-0119]